MKMGSGQSANGNQPSNGNANVELTGTNIGIVCLIIAAMLVLIFLIIYIVQQVKRTKLQNVNLQKDAPSALIQMDNRQSVPYRVPANNMALVSNGQEFSISFWVFLGSNYAATTGQKMIMARGNGNTYNGSTIEITKKTSPVIFVDSNSNTMYFAVSTSKAAASMTPAEIIHTVPNGTYDSGWLVAKVDYVPLQRWVYLTMTLQQTNLQVFLDGDLYSVATLGDIVNNLTGMPIIHGSSGDLLIGDSINYTPGYIAKASFYNYALTQSDVKTMYAAGPNTNSYLSYIGLGNYAVRSPIYQVA